MHSKLNLKNGDRVKIIKFPAKDMLLSAKGKVVGKSAQGLIDFYIIELDHAVIENDFCHQCVNIPEVCLERI